MDCRAALREAPDESVHCIVTSPPYWGLRDYGVEGQMGLEQSLGEHIAAMVEVFEECKRVLRKDGTFWLNYGDCYATAPNGRSAADTKSAGTDDRTFRDKPFSTVGGTLKPKDLCMVPNRIAIALQEAGWWVRSEIVWGKPNAMPDSSGTGRPSSAHEKIFLLTKSAGADVWRARDTGEMSYAPDLTERAPLITYPSRDGARWLRIGAYYDAEAVRVQRAQNEDAKSFRGDSYTQGEAGPRGVVGNKRIDKQRGHSRRGAGFNDRWDAMSKEEQQANGRLLRNYEPAPLDVWRIASVPFKGAHFATFPPELAKRCILAGCPEGGVVLDPFAGAGTTGIVAERLNRSAILVELSPEYCALIRQRLEDDRAKRGVAMAAE